MNDENNTMWAEIKQMNHIIPQKAINHSNIDLSDRMRFQLPDDALRFDSARKVKLPKNLKNILKDCTGIPV